MITCFLSIENKRRKKIASDSDDDIVAEEKKYQKECVYDRYLFDSLRFICI